ncbi:helix-turn-helix domain-containing protein [Streptomyces sp. NPDC014733]|uniref:helix-turn-helix domain-containing protein n=1 Tax=Streptomyces sp. NPDC014733 TaxID=3364885 RepID=UPI0036FF5F0D
MIESSSRTATPPGGDGALHQVVALVHAPQPTFELGCAAEVFGTRRPGFPPYYAFRICAPRPGPVATTAGYTLHATAGLSALDGADTVVVPGWAPEAPLPEEIRGALRGAHARGARMVGLCSGAYALAAAGLLDGRRATTHWRRAAHFAARFPRVRMDATVLYIDHGDVATSAGAAAGIDLCLHLVRADHGAGYAARVGRDMGVPPHREGGQTQFTGDAVPRRAEPSLAPLLDWVSGRLGTRVSVAEMAARLRVSPRTLARRFTDQVGISPGQWLLAQRISAARTLLEETDLPVEAVAVRVGLSSAANLRRRFHHALGTTPAAYRSTFRHRSRTPAGHDGA